MILQQLVTFENKHFTKSRCLLRFLNVGAPEPEKPRLKRIVEIRVATKLEISTGPANRRVTIPESPCETREFVSKCEEVPAGEVQMLR